VLSCVPMVTPANARAPTHLAVLLGVGAVQVAQKDYEKERTAPDGQEWKQWG